MIVERYADKLQARKRLSASSAGSTATARTSTIAVPEPSPPEAPCMPIFRSPRSGPAPSLAIATIACAEIRTTTCIGGPSNALPLSCGRPSAADRQLQRLVRRRTLVLGILRDSSLSPPLPPPSFAELSWSPPQALIAAASGTVGDARSHTDLRCGPVRTRRYSHLPSRLSVERLADKLRRPSGDAR